MSITFLYTDPAAEGMDLVALILNDALAAWNRPTTDFRALPRQSTMEIALEPVSGSLPGSFVPSAGAMPDMVPGSGFIVRVEEAGDSTHTPLAAVSLDSLERLVDIDYDDILDLLIPGSGVDGYGDDTWREVFLQMLSTGFGGLMSGKGERAVLRTAKPRARRRLDLLLSMAGTNTAIRRLLVAHAHPTAAFQMPPDAFR